MFTRRRCVYMLMHAHCCAVRTGLVAAHSTTLLQKRRSPMLMPCRHMSLCHVQQLQQTSESC
jgi:hypothetical protein